MEYSVCLSAVFSGISLPDALYRAHQAGATAYEFWSWWDQDLDALENVQKKTGLRAAAFCTRFVPLNDPDTRALYIGGLRASIEAAHRLGCRTLISQVGQELPGLSRTAQHQSIVAGLRACAPLLEREGIALAIEPLNTQIDHKGYYLSRSDEAFDIIREVNSPCVKVLFDVYHQRITEGDVLPHLMPNLDCIGHIHVAGHPGRHEPLENSDIDYMAMCEALKRAGYSGCVGLEYFPLRDPIQGVRQWMAAMRLM